MFQSLISKVLTIITSSIFYATVKDCSLGTSLFTLNEATLTPVTPSPGENVTLFIDYTVPPTTTVIGGSAEYDVTYNFIPFSPTFEPLCGNIPCPLAPGRYQNYSVSAWPTDLSGTLVTKMKWWNVDKVQLLCVEIGGKFWTPTDLVLVHSNSSVGKAH